MIEEAQNRPTILGREKAGWIKKRSRGLFPRWQSRFARVSENCLILFHQPDDSRARKFKISSVQAENDHVLLFSSLVTCASYEH